MKKYLLFTFILAIFALGASVNAQSVSFISATPNKEQGVNIRFQTMNPNPADVVFDSLQYSLDPSFKNGVFFLKKYSYSDSLKDVSDSLDDTNYNFPSPGTPIYLRLKFYPDTSKWQPMYSLVRLVTLKAKPKPATINVVSKPFATASGAVTTLSLNSNVDFTLKKYVHFKDSLKVYSSGSIQTLNFTAGKYTFTDTIPNLTQSSWLGYEIINEISTVQTGVLKVGQYVPPAKPFGQFDSLVGFADKLHGVMSIVGNGLGGNAYVYRKHATDATFTKVGPYAFNGNGVEKTAFDLPVTKTGKWKVYAELANTKGIYTIDTVTVDNTTGPATTINIIPLTASDNGPGSIKLNFRVNTTEDIDVYSMVAHDTTFSPAETCDKPMRITKNGDYTMYINGLQQNGNLWVTYYYVTVKGGKYVPRVRPYVSVFVKFTATVKKYVKPVALRVPSNVKVGEGFTIVYKSKPETMTITDGSGRTVYQDKIKDGQYINTSNFTEGIYYWQIKDRTGKILVH